MKKFYVLICLIGLSAYTIGQTYLSENFSSNQMPPSGWSIDNLATKWSVSGTANAGGTAPEAMFTWINEINYTRLISPEVDMTGVTSISLMFNMFYDDYTGTGPLAGVATRSGGGDWTSVWEINPTSNVGPDQFAIEIDNADLGQTDFQFCFYLDGNLYNIDYWYIDDILLFNPLALDAELSAINVPQYIPYGNDVELTGTVKNLGSETITSMDITYSVNEGEANTYEVTGLSLEFGQSFNFTHDTPINLPEAGTYQVDVTVENINGGEDEDISNNMLTAYVGAVPFIPEKKVFAEEATGTWCGWCVRGTCYMDYMYDTYPDTWLGVAIHNSDPMENAVYDDAISGIIPNFPGYPSATVDRSGANYVDPSGFEDAYMERIDAISPATIHIVNFNWEPVTRVVTFELKAEFIVDVYNELRFAAVMVEDSVWGTSSQWAQANYYSGGANGPMCGYEDMPNPVPAADMHYDHVAREILDGPFGTAGSLPEAMMAGESYFFEYTYTVPEEWIFENMHFIGLLLDQTTGEVLNCNDQINYTTGIEDNKTIADLNVYPNPTTGVVYFSGTDLDQAVVTVYNITGSEVGTFTNIHAEKLDLSHLQDGIYILNVVIDNQTTLKKKISILK